MLAWVQGPQWMLQWVRQGRMMRLTWRVDNNAKVASVSLVDGWILDDWGRNRDERPLTVDPKPARDTLRPKPARPAATAPAIETPSPR